jgi:hypothetical protein
VIFGAVTMGTIVSLTVTAATGGRQIIDTCGVKPSLLVPISLPVPEPSEIACKPLT